MRLSFSNWCRLKTEIQVAIAMGKGCILWGRKEIFRYIYEKQPPKLRFYWTIRGLLWQGLKEGEEEWSGVNNVNGDDLACNVGN